MILQGFITVIYYYNAKKYLKCFNTTIFQLWITVLEGVPVHGGGSGIRCDLRSQTILWFCDSMSQDTLKEAWS